MKKGFFFVYFVGSVALTPLDAHAGRGKDQPSASEPASFRAVPNITYEVWQYPAFQKSYVAFSKKHPLAWHQYARDRQKEPSEPADPAQKPRWVLFEQQRPAYLTWLEQNPEATEGQKQAERKRLMEAESTEEAQARSKASEAWVHDLAVLHKDYQNIVDLFNDVQAHEAQLTRHLQARQGALESTGASEEEQSHAKALDQDVLRQHDRRGKQKKRAFVRAKTAFEAKHLTPEQPFLDALIQKYERDLKTLTKERDILNDKTVAWLEQNPDASKKEKNAFIKTLNEESYKPPITAAIKKMMVQLEKLKAKKGVLDNLETSALAMLKAVDKKHTPA
ncbi:hypothetical protein EIL50_04555 [bacterium NHP-B]|nr:hypothetical protein EIL50_04555 [bacterium NHP-B]